MNCKEFEHLIPKFLDKTMDFRTMREFHAHMDSCSACREELSIQFLVREGLKHLEDDGAFDLQQELENRLAENRRKLDRHAGMMLAKRYFYTWVIAILGIFLIYYFG